MNSNSDSRHEQAAYLGIHTLTNTDLVALLLSDNASDDGGTTHRLLTKFRSLRSLARCDARELATVGGLTMDKAVVLAAAFELGRRVERETIAKLRIDSPKIVCQLLASDLRALTRESLRALLLDAKFQLLRIEEISLGSISESVAHPREIFRPAIAHSAYTLILVHNHPSGDPTPSAADKALTRNLVEAGKVLQIALADHIIIGGMQAGKPSYYSFKEAGAIP